MSGYEIHVWNKGNQAIDTITEQGHLQDCIRCGFAYRIHSGYIKKINGKWLCYKCEDHADYSTGRPK